RRGGTADPRGRRSPRRGGGGPAGDRRSARLASGAGPQHAPRYLTGYAQRRSIRSARRTGLHGRREGDKGAAMAGEGREGVRLLVVDDEENITDLLATALRYERFDVAVAHTGREALAKVTEFRPHLIVLDVMLPDWNGFDVARRLSD